MFRRNPHHRRLLLLVYAGITGILAAVTALAIPASASAPMTHFEIVAAGSVIAIGSLLAVTGLWTATGVYAVVFWCFHFGLVAVLASGWMDSAELSVWDEAWVLGPFVTDAALLALAGAFAFSAGAALIHALRSDVSAPASGTSAHGVHEHGPAGSVLLLLSIVVWCGLVAVTAGTTAFVTSYGEYLEATSELGEITAVIWIVLGCGLVLSVSGTPGRLRTAATGAFIALSVVVLPLGLRGEILFRSMAALVAAARAGRVLSLGKTAAFGLALLVIIPVVREVRATGIKGVSDAVVEPRLYEGFAEMGGSLHPVEKVVRWHAEGEPFEWGSSYWAPIERTAARLLPDLVSTEAENDMRIMNVLVIDRIGPIGFSPVAEAFRNLGPLGVVLVLALIGAGLAAIDTARDRRLAVLAIAAVYVPLLTNVRNSFVSVPAHCAAGVAIILCLGLMRHVAASVLCRPYARPSYLRSKV